MLIPGISTVNNSFEVSDAQVFVAVKNSYSTATVVVGTPVVWDYTTDVDGIGVILPTTALLRAPAGLVAQRDIAAGAFGLVQCYGHFTSARVFGAAAVAKGDAMGCANGATRLERITATVSPAASGTPYFVAGYASSTTTGTLTGKTVFIRCM